MEIASHLKEHLNMPVYVDNDANVVALGEFRFGAAKRFSSAICITMGTGIGGGIIINRQLWRGASFSAGEIGHIIVNENGRPCKCGNKGCLETYCASQPIIDRTREKLASGMTETMDEILEGNIDNLTIKKLFAAGKKSDETALAVIEETGDGATN